MAIRTVILLALSVTAACGPTVVGDGPASESVDEALFATGETGAAGRIVDCETSLSGANAHPGQYDDGAVSDDPENALETAVSERAVDGVTEGYRVAKREEARVLFTFEMEGTTRQAIVVHHGETIDGTGWYVESWARCDLSELPVSVADAAGIEVWEDSRGERVPISEVQSYAGSAHCDWEEMTFLEINDRVYVRNPEPGLGDFFSEPYAAAVDLPASAVDTGYRLDGRRLWLSADRKRAYVETGHNVELWPATVRRLGCA